MQGASSASVKVECRLGQDGVWAMDGTAAGWSICACVKVCGREQVERARERRSSQSYC